MRYLTPILLIILICVMTYFLGGFLGILLKGKSTCDGYKRVINELQVEKEYLIQEIQNKEDIIINMADLEYFNR